MLLALLDLFEQGVIKENKIAYSKELLEVIPKPEMWNVEC